jgi:uncharacterized OB-fold protein
MALTKCKECGKEISTKAESCPSCGMVLKKKASLLDYFAGGFLTFLVLIILFVVGWSLIDFNSTKPESGISLPSIGTDIVSFDEYQRIEVGMSYKQVVEIIGVDGEEISRNKIDGIPGVMESIETVMYQWANKNGASMNAMFQNNKLSQKAQFGLK